MGYEHFPRDEPNEAAVTLHARILRGAREIGGSCVELEYEGARGHPIFVGEAGARIRDEAGFFVGRMGGRAWVGGFSKPLRHRRAFEVGPFRITPFLKDHSAFDTYSILVEAGGRRIFYTSDLRAHGRKPGCFRELLRRPPENVDVLLMEGTRVGRGWRSRGVGVGENLAGTHVGGEQGSSGITVRGDTGSPSTHVGGERSLPSTHVGPKQSSWDTHVGTERSPRGMTEREVEDAAADFCREVRGPVLALYSPQNIDRLVSIYRVCLRSDRTFVMDLYAHSVAVSTGRLSIPRAGWEQVRVYLPKSQRRRVLATKEFHRTDSVRGARIYPEELASRRHELVLTFRYSMAAEIEEAGCLEDAAAIWSMWAGYLGRDSGRELEAWLDSREIPMSVIQSSGHASVFDLKRLVSAIGAGRVVPIHTGDPEGYLGLFPGVEAPCVSVRTGYRRRPSTLKNLLLLGPWSPSFCWR